MTLRLRLTLAYIGLLLPALVAFSFVVNFIASRRLYGALDDGLQARINAVDSRLPHARQLSSADVMQSLASLDYPAAGFSFWILDPGGALLYASSAAANRESPDLHSFPRGSHFLTRKSGGQNLRFAYEPITVPDGTTLGYIETATSMKQTDDALDELEGVFVIGGTLVLLLTGVPAYLLAGRALQPVRELSALATEIERTADFTKRLPSQPSRGEVSDLVKTFNGMVQRVERMLVAQRDFLAESSHELRRPLAVLRTYIDLLREPDLTEEERDDCVNEMRTEAEAMGKLISDLLLLSREGEQTMRSGDVDVSSVCARLIERLRDEGSRHRITLEAAQDVHVLGDSEKIEQMVRNLLENAAQNTPLDGEITLKVWNGAGSTRIEVHDSGRGIPPDEQEHVFERFFRGREARATRSDGMGLGLSIVKHVAEGHGGKVAFVSRPGLGTSFTVEFPAQT